MCTLHCRRPHDVEGKKCNFCFLKTGRRVHHRYYNKRISLKSVIFPIRQDNVIVYLYLYTNTYVRETNTVCSLYICILYYTYNIQFNMLTDFTPSNGRVSTLYAGSQLLLTYFPWKKIGIYLLSNEIKYKLAIIL